MSNFLALLLFAPFVVAGLKAKAARDAARPIAKVFFDDARKRAIADRSLDSQARDWQKAWGGLFPPQGDTPGAHMLCLQCGAGAGYEGGCCDHCGAEIPYDR